MGTIDEGYASREDGNGQSSTPVNRMKYPTMIPSSVQNHNLTATSQSSGMYDVFMIFSCFKMS